MTCDLAAIREQHYGVGPLSFDQCDALITEVEALRRERLEIIGKLRAADVALIWYASMLRPEDRLTDNGDKAEAAIAIIEANPFVDPLRAKLEKALLLFRTTCTCLARAGFPDTAKAAIVEIEKLEKP